MKLLITLCTLFFFISACSEKAPNIEEKINFKDEFEKQDAICSFGYAMSITEVFPNGFARLSSDVRIMEGSSVTRRVDRNYLHSEVDLRKCIPAISIKKRNRAKIGLQSKLTCGRYTGRLQNIFADGRGLIEFTENNKYLWELVILDDCYDTSTNKQVSFSDFNNP